MLLLQIIFEKSFILFDRQTLAHSENLHLSQKVAQFAQQWQTSIYATQNCFFFFIDFMSFLTTNS